MTHQLQSWKSAYPGCMPGRTAIGEAAQLATWRNATWQAHWDGRLATSRQRKQGLVCHIEDSRHRIAVLLHKILAAMSTQGVSRSSQFNKANLTPIKSAWPVP